MCKKCKELIKTLENMYNKKKLAVYDKKIWPLYIYIYIYIYADIHCVCIYQAIRTEKMFS